MGYTTFPNPKFHACEIWEPRPEGLGGRDQRSVASGPETKRFRVGKKNLRVGNHGLSNPSSHDASEDFVFGGVSWALFKKFKIFMFCLIFVVSVSRNFFRRTFAV